MEKKIKESMEKEAVNLGFRISFSYMIAIPIIIIVILLIVGYILWIYVIGPDLVDPGALNLSEVIYR